MKPGFKTSEFWLTLLTNLLPLFSGALAPEHAAALGAVTTGIYTGARAYAKSKNAK